MSFDFYKKIAGKFKNYSNKIGQLEDSVLDERQNFKDLFERNIVLEKEITDRTEELNQANKSILTLKHIWSTMNSSEPLSEVLSTVVSGLTEELGYLFSFVSQLQTNDKGEFIKIKSYNHTPFSSKIESVLENTFDSIEIPCSENQNAMINAIKNNKVMHVKNFKQLLHGTSPAIDYDYLEKIDAASGNRCITILPIFVQDRPFGCLTVVSIRSEISDTEKNFLSLFVEQIELAVRIADLFQQVREQAITDALTTLYNRRYFEQSLTSEADRALRLKQPFTLISVDLDHLKFINDNLGHSAGDAAICHIGKILKQNARSIDIPARVGGEEFSLILPGIDVEGGRIAAERLRIAISSEAVENVGVITASIGVATFLSHTESTNELVELVDQALYRAKRNGRNQVQVANQQQDDWQFLALDAFMDAMIKRHIPISPAVAAELIIKLKSSEQQEKALSDFLYYVVDSIARSFNPLFKNVFLRKKIDAIYHISQALHISQDLTEDLVLATLLQDLGNMTVPEDILMKPGPLTEDEMKKVFENPIATTNEIFKHVTVSDNILFTIKHYYEKWNGTGYPEGLAGEKLPIGSRILAIVNAYFAMKSDRPHRKALTHEEAILALAEGSGKEWDPKIVDVFVKLINKTEKVTDKR